MWTHFEAVHAVTYFHPRARAAYEAVGLRGYWRGYFAGRSAPLGATEAAPVIAAFFTFAPPMVSRALPAVWRLATPAEALRARLTGAVQALAELTYELPEAHLMETADLLEEAATAAQTAGRVLGAANAALPIGEYPLARIWQAATTLREQRGDGHVAALVAAGLDPVETLAWKVAVGMSPVNLLGRGWTEEQWHAACERLTQRGWLTPDGTATEQSRADFQAVEDATDRAAEHPWLALGVDRTDRLRELLEPIARSCHTLIPPDSPIGLPPLPA
ncbi:SCO6745 family protein [Micromonospora profundi]|uniref:SCO6745 family protein n=1 Tax=Micromonospora profundi TaxID=1420889 RepID=UPI00381CBACD